MSLKDSIYNEEFTTSLMETESELMERANLAQIASQKQLIELKE